jgi:hypothetical protein
MAKTLVVCCDGTNNQFDGYHTNVIRAYKVARRHPGQLTYYDPGVGPSTAVLPVSSFDAAAPGRKPNADPQIHPQTQDIRSHSSRAAA